MLMNNNTVIIYNIWALGSLSQQINSYMKCIFMEIIFFPFSLKLVSKQA